MQICKTRRKQTTIENRMVIVEHRVKIEWQRKRLQRFLEPKEDIQRFLYPGK